MIVYKFGGASVKSPDGIRNIAKIVSLVQEDLFIVVSAMGKTTNAMEVVLDFFMKAEKESALNKLAEVENYHREITTELFSDKSVAENAVKPLFDELKELITTGIGTDYDRWYDRLVSYGEVISTKIVSEFLLMQGIQNRWLDMRQLLVTDSNFREANVHMLESEKRRPHFLHAAQYILLA